MVRGRALSVLTLVALGCTAPVVTPTATVPTAPAADALVLRMIVDEFPSPATLNEPPEFSLYADGHVIYIEEQPQPANWQLRHAQLDTTAMRGLVEQAVAALRDAQASYDDVADDGLSRHDPWTRFDLRTPELRKLVSVNALGERDDDAPSRAIRAQLNVIRERLLGFSREIEAGNALDLGAYAPAAFLVELVEAPAELPDKIPWPWPALDVRDFAQTERIVFGRVMGAAELDRVLPFADGDFLIATAPSGGRYMIYLTPLMPDELTG